jgi:tetratricopeptide repeat protein
MAPDRVICPRCGESLPPTLDRCDACGADLRARGSSGPTTPAPQKQGGARAARREPEGVPGVAWLLLVVGLAVGGMVGFALHSAIGPRGEEGMPTGPADIMAGGGSGGAPASGGGMGAGAGAGAPQMPTQIVQMVKAYKAAIAKNPKDLEAITGLANLEFDSGQWEKAIDYYTRALAIDPGNADVRVDRAIAYHSSGQNDLAKKELLRVTRERPSHRNAWLNLGVVMRETGDLQGAVTAWERYLEIDPNGEHAADIRKELANLKQAG